MRLVRSGRGQHCVVFSGGPLRKAAWMRVEPSRVVRFRKGPKVVPFAVLLVLVSLLSSVGPSGAHAGSPTDDDAAISKRAQSLKLPWAQGTWNVTQGVHQGNAWDFQPPGAGSHNNEVLAVGSGTARLSCADSEGQAIVSLTVDGSTFRYAHLQTSAVRAAGISETSRAVRQGQVLGRLYPSSGWFDSGCGSGQASHLHFEVPRVPITIDGVSLSSSGPSGGSLRSTNVRGGVQEPAPTSLPGGGPIKGLDSSRCMDVEGGGAQNGAWVQLYDCHGRANQVWKHSGGQIRVYGNYNKCLDADGSSGATVGNGRKVQIYDCNGRTNQRWTRHADGTITWDGDGRCLDAVGKATANNTRLVLWDCYDAGNQKWYGSGSPLPATSNGGEVIRGVGSNRCIDTYYGEVYNPTPVQLYDCHGTSNQRWKWVARQLKVYGNYDKCLDAEAWNGATPGNGRKVQIYDCNGGRNQQWIRYGDGTIRSALDGRCLDALGKGTANSTPLVLWDCYGGSNQKWRGKTVPIPSAVRSGQVIRGQRSNRCLDVDATAAGPGVAVGLYDCHGGANQRWRLVKGQLRVYGNYSMCLDADGGPEAVQGNGRKVQVWPCNTSVNQRWTKRTDGTLRWKGDGRCLDPLGKATANGTRLVLWDCYRGNNQKWKFGGGR